MLPSNVPNRAQRQLCGSLCSAHNLHTLALLLAYLFGPPSQANRGKAGPCSPCTREIDTSLCLYAYDTSSKHTLRG